MTSIDQAARAARAHARRGLAVFALTFAASPLLAQTPPPYSLPWQLRPASVGNVVRLDTAAAFWDDAAGRSGTTQATSLIVTRRLRPSFGLLGRAIVTHNDPPTGAGGSALANPLLGAIYAKPLRGGWRLSALLASTIPVGSGGGDQPDPGAAQAHLRGIAARSGMDNTLFAVNYWGLVAGVDFARVTPGLTLQAEATLFQLKRVRGPRTQDSARTNFTTGLHVGRFLTPRLSLGGEVRYQRWLTNAAPVRADRSARGTATFAVGPRLHFKLGPRTWLRPGIAYARALDDPLKRQHYGIVQLDVPVAF
jgi:hypothetical protein